ncbi:TrkH family potassium uptake protein [Brevibacillus ruminantium]|uniref:TrkH family potassium uptake protein n=1 Tax=Brevibacillus ruminantium TaxID=2950604 RepID=A0ABY4WPA0_9BACL|nr:TrkH family potassium uptake protein [Brevibacillus ruminantium]USG67907.1 TrkH family potassium uptake protein [Brevibacillus ruminantium]
MAITYNKRKFSSVQIIVFLYLASVLVASLLLWLPFFQLPGVTLSFIDALFTAASAISVTGLNVVTIHEVFNQRGVILLTLLFQIGGIGIMTLGTFFWMMLGQRIGLEYRKWIATDHNRPTLSGLVDLMRNILVLAVVIELAGTILLGSYFLIAGYHQDWYEAFYYGFFAAVSAFTNAGFDIYGNSLHDFSKDYILQSITMLLIVCGAVGFPVLIELKNYIAHRRMGRRFAFSLFTKITTITFFLLIVLGTLLFFLFEKDSFLQGKNWHEALFFSLFQSVTTRSAGLSTMDSSILTTPTAVIMSCLMFIGASPSSVGGGIRTTTFFVLVVTVASYMRGRKDVKVFGRELVEEDIMRSFIVFFVAIMLVLTAVLSLMWIENLPLPAVLFEVCSAFGTTGLSMGITPELSGTGKMILIIMMVIGRIGIINLLLFLKKDDYSVSYHYPKERIIIGQ